MKRIFRGILALAVFAALLTILSADLYCQADRSNAVVNAVRTKNNKVISTETILSKIKVRPGDKFNQEALNDDLKRLYATEYFTDVSVDVEDFEGGLAVTFVVEEKSVIDDILFEGNTIFRSQKLKSSMKSKPNDMLNMAVLAQDIAEIKDMYSKKGYPAVDVKYDIDVDKNLNKAKINIKIDEKQRVKVAKVEVTGNKAIPTGNIKKILATKPAWLFNPGIFKEETIQDDMDRIKSLYDDEGFLDVDTKPKTDYSEGGNTLNVTFEITEGKRYMVGDIVVNGDVLLPEKDVRSKIKMRPGKPFSTKALRMDVAEVKQFYYHQGYMNAVVDVERNLNAATGNIDIKYTIDAKKPVYVGKIDIKGNNKTKDVVIRRELRLYPGERFDGEKIRRSKERLYNLGLFEDINFDTEPTENPDVQNLIVNVKETKTGEFSFGGGYSSIDQLIGFASITQRNFDILNFPSFTGAGQNLTIKAEVGMVRNDYNVSWTEPWVFGKPYLFGTDLYRTSHLQDTTVGWPYEEVRTGGDLRLGKEFTDTFRGDLTYRLENIKIGNMIDNASQDMQDEVGSNVISSVTLELTQDTRDNIYNPVRGYILNGSIENAGGICLGDKNFLKGTATAAYYHTFFEKIVLELKVRGGLANAYGSSDEVPIYERFFAGGANTIRGYKERRVGPRDPGSDEPIGGEAIGVGNAEITFPVYEKVLKGAVFYDVGNVWRRAEDWLVGGDYKHGIGLGIRVKTPLGPVKVDYGYPLVRQEGDSRTGEFYFSMSHGF